MNISKWKKAAAFAIAMSIASNLVADEGRSEKREQKPSPATKIESPKGELSPGQLDAGEDYVVVMTDKDTSPLKVYQKYLDSADFWRQLAEHNLLKKGVAIKIPKDMLKTEHIPAKITKFNGRVEVARNFDWKWVRAVPDMLVQEGDWIRTGKKASAEVLQDDGTVIKLRPGTKLLFQANGTSKTARGEVRTTSVKLESGSILARVKKLARRDSRFEIRTPTATSFIRGTEFRVKVEEAGATRLEVLEGSVDFGDESQVVSVAGNFGSLVTAEGAAPSSPQSLPAAPAELISPEDRQVINDLSDYQFSWASVDVATQYHVEVAMDSEFKALVDETFVQSTSAAIESMDLQNLEPGTYYWRVAAKDGQGYESAWSETRHFIHPLALN